MGANNNCKYYGLPLTYLRIAPAQKNLQQLKKKIRTIPNGSCTPDIHSFHFGRTRNATFALFFQSLSFPPAYFRV